MTRSGFRTVMFLLLFVLLGLSGLIFYWCQKLEADIVSRQNNLTRLKQELENARSLNTALTELDQLTINEKTATQLDILRHLGLEQTDLEFRVESREMRSVGITNLYVHSVRLAGALAYPAALRLADSLQATKKIMITDITLRPVTTDTGDKIQLTLTGRIYGLDKRAAEEATP